MDNEKLKKLIFFVKFNRHHYCIQNNSNVDNV